jgi:putative phage-type endonuclease
MTTVQGSEEWVKQRLGKVTASVIHKVYSDKLTATKKNLMRSLALERLSGSRMSNIKTVDMARGLAIEPLARKAYEIATQQKVSLVGFISHPDIKNAGASPDGLIGEKGFIEIKCLNIRNHNQIIKNKKIPKQYYYQMQFQLACSQREWGDFVAYHPEADESLYIERVAPEHNIIQELQSKVINFLTDVEQLFNEIKKSNAEELHRYL